jgi:TPR repeat protein
MTTHDQTDHALNALRRNDFSTAVDLLRPLADAGSPDAQYHLASIAFTESEAVSGREAHRLLESAAAQGHMQATYELATFPEFRNEGFVSPLTDPEREALLLRVAGMGHTQAQYDLGAGFAAAGPADLPQAISWYKRAAQDGHAEAQFNLAFMLLNGEGCTADKAAAIRWLQAAAAQKHEQSIRLLREMQDAG